MRRQAAWCSVSSALLLTSCGAGIVANLDLPPGPIAVIALIIVAALLYVGYVMGRGR